MVDDSPTVDGIFAPSMCELVAPRCPSASGITNTGSKSTQNAPRIRCAFVVELMCAFTLLALRCVNTFYLKRLKDVETINQIQ